MSVFKGLSIKGVFGEVALIIVTSLLVAAIGAGSIVAGLVEFDSAHVCVCAAWGMAGLISGYRATSEHWLIRSLAFLVAAMVIMWLVGLTVPGGQPEEIGQYLRYIGSGFAGVLASTIMRHRKGKQRKGKKGKRILRR